MAGQPLEGDSTDKNVPGVKGTNSGIGNALGFIAGKNPFADRAVGAFGRSDGTGVIGIANNANGTGVYGGSVGGVATGVTGEGTSGNGVAGQSTGGVGVTGSTQSNAQSAIFGFNGAKGQVPEGLNRPAGGGVWGHTTVEKGSGVIGSVEPGLTQAAGVTGIGPIAGHFFGDVLVTGDVKLVNGADCAEDFDVVESETIEPGTVMVIDDEGALRRGWRPYDRRVAGVVCGAGDYRPGIVLDRREGDSRRLPVALLGKVNCQVDADYEPIEVGDPLTTSATPGHAMKACDPVNAFGAVIGKALRRLERGRGCIPILVALQ